jgi:hypothetical protein
LPALLPWSFALGQALLVASLQDCPAPALVDARVREILGLGAEAVLDEHASIEREGAAIRVTFRGKDEQMLGDRVLQADGSCAELAGAVAVVLASWLSDVHPEYVGAMPRVEPALAAPSPPAAIADGPTPATNADKSPATRRHGLLGVALGADLSRAAPVPLAALSFRYMPAGFGLGAAVSATVIGERNVELSTGSVRYFRWPLLVGPALRVPLGAAKLDLHAGAALGWLHVEGVDFSPPVSHDVFLGGGFLATRVSLGSSSFVPFAELSGVLWRATEAFVRRGPDEPTVSLPSLELYATLGGTWRAW